MRKSLVVMAVAAGVALSSSWAGAATTLRFTHGMGSGEVGFQMFQEFADNVTKRTNGEVKFHIFPADQLGKETDTLQQAKSGAIDVTAGSMAMLSPLVPAMEMVNAPFIWKDWNEAEKVIKGPAFDPLFDELRDKHNLVPLSRVFYFGWRNFTFTKAEVRKPSDMAGLKIRVPESPLWVEMVKALGAMPTPVPFSEVYTALQQKLVDGQENPIPTITARKYNEVQGVLTVSKHMLQNNIILMNKNSMARLKPEQREIMIEEADKIAKKNADIVQGQEGSMLSDLAKSGKIKVIADPDRDAFQLAVQPANEALAKSRWGVENFERLRAAINLNRGK